MKRLFALLLLALIAVGFFSMPKFVQSAIPSAYYVTPAKINYENIVNCTGTILAAEVREVYLQSAIVPSAVYVDIGDIVSQGDTIALVDKEMSASMGFSATSLLNNMTTDVNGSSGAGSIDWISMASNYGLSAVLSGGQIDYSQLYNAISGDTIGQPPNSANTASIIEDAIPSEITAPISGIITNINICENSPSTPGKSVLTISNVDKFMVLCTVSEADISKINVGDSAKIRGIGFNGNIYDGVVTKIYPTAKKSITGTDTVIDVEVELLNKSKDIKPGFSAKVEIIGGANYELITVPYEAIRQDENNDEYVYIYENGKLQKQTVITGQELASEVEILDGVNDNSIIVYNPNALIKDGSMINLKGRAHIEESS